MKVENAGGFALSGLAIIPDASILEEIVNLRQQLGDLVTGPMLGLEVNIPHISVLQCPFQLAGLTAELLQQISLINRI